MVQGQTEQMIGRADRTNKETRRLLAEFQRAIDRQLSILREMSAVGQKVQEEVGRFTRLKGVLAISVRTPTKPNRRLIWEAFTGRPTAWVEEFKRRNHSRPWKGHSSLS